jgi:tetratricopeptide (TPR) repeat protein
VPPRRLLRPTLPATALCLLVAVASVGAVALAPSVSKAALRAAAVPSVSSGSDLAGAGDLPLAAVLDHLPIVAGSRSTAEGRIASDAFERASLQDPTGLEELYAASVDALEVETGDRGLLDEALGLMLEETQGVANDAPGTEVTLRLAAEALRVDPANADRINNAAVALWLYAVVSAVDSTDDDDWFLQHAALRLLAASARAFPEHRALLLNLAFLKATTPGWGMSGDEEARTLVERDAGDHTARALLASIQSRRGDDPDGAARAASTLQPLLEDPATAALAEALTADAHLAAASIRRAEAPAQARREAALALAAYDRAAALSADPEIQAGRARALELLGDLGGAAEAQATAAAGRSSTDFDIDLARLRHRTGDAAGLRSTAGAAVDRVMAGWDPRLSTARYVVEPSFAAERVPEDRGFLGWSIGSAADHVPLTVFEEIVDGGPGIVVIDTVELEFPGVDHDLAVSLAPRSAWRLALTAAVLDGDGAAAERLADLWDQAITWDGFWGTYVDAAHIVAGGPRAFDAAADPIDALELAQEAFARAGMPAEAAELCRRVGQLGCAGANALRHGEASALEELKGAFEEASSEDPDGPLSSLRMLVAAAAEASGDPATAETFLKDTAGADDAGALRVRAAIRLGDLRLDAGDPAAAATWYELALAAIDANELTTIRDYHRDAAAALEQRGLAQVARNNRGVAVLRTLQADDGTAPPCTDAAIRPRCEAALADFSAAAASDPANAVYRMNVGWAARLLDRPEEARSALDAAVALDPQLYPAFNDLGVLLARSGDTVGARAAFEAALAADGSYDLAGWNLGILALRDAPAGLLDAQALLAGAIRRNPDLRAAPLDFRADERTYRFGFEASLPLAEGMALGRTYSVGAVVLAGVTSIAALAQLQATMIGHAVQTASSGTRGWLEKQTRKVRWRARQRNLRRRMPRAARGWLPWLGIVLVLGIVTGWQAAQSSPAAPAGAVVLALAAGVIALAVHFAGHALGARALGGRLIPAAWTPGAIVALVFLPVQAGSGPFFAERLRLPNGGRSRAWQFHLAGPAANLVAGVVAYGLFLAEPAPVLRLFAQVQLAAIAYTLLPIEPLDGWAIQRRHPHLLVVLGFGVVGLGAAFALGLL